MVKAFSVYGMFFRLLVQCLFLLPWRSRHGGSGFYRNLYCSSIFCWAPNFVLCSSNIRLLSLLNLLMWKIGHNFILFLCWLFSSPFSCECSGCNHDASGIGPNHWSALYISSFIRQSWIRICSAGCISSIHFWLCSRNRIWSSFCLPHIRGAE